MNELWFGDFGVDVISDFGPNSTLCDDPPKNMPITGRVGFVIEGGEMLEREYQALLIPRIVERFGPERTRVAINDPNLPGQQGIPDLTVYVGPMWGFLEVKASEKSKLRPNQQYWVDYWGQYAFCSFIYPENEEEVLNALSQALRC